jgi:hypothetical protein
MQSGSSDLMIKNCLEATRKGIQATGEASSPQKEHPALQIKNKNGIPYARIRNTG